MFRFGLRNLLFTFIEAFFSATLQANELLIKMNIYKLNVCSRLNQNSQLHLKHTVALSTRTISSTEPERFAHWHFIWIEFLGLISRSSSTVK